MSTEPGQLQTMFFLFIIMGSTDERAPAGLAPIAIGLGLTLIHLISIPVTNTSVNPARSTGVALFVGDWAIAQLWLFWVAPILGGVIGAVVYKAVASPSASPSGSSRRPRRAMVEPENDRPGWHIRESDLTAPEVVELVSAHLEEMHRITPAKSAHALGVEALRHPDITFWSLWEGPEVLGCGALRQLDATHGEIKSMRTAPAHRRRGVAVRLLEHILTEAQRRGYRRVSLETGATAPFAPARALYARRGFRRCDRFADYADDPHSYFMTLEF